MPRTRAALGRALAQPCTRVEVGCCAFSAATPNPNPNQVDDLRALELRVAQRSKVVASGPTAVPAEDSMASAGIQPRGHGLVGAWIRCKGVASRALRRVRRRLRRVHPRGRQKGAQGAPPRAWFDAVRSAVAAATVCRGGDRVRPLRRPAGVQNRVLRRLSVQRVHGEPRARARRVYGVNCASQAVEP